MITTREEKKESTNEESNKQMNQFLVLLDATFRRSEGDISIPYGSDLEDLQARPTDTHTADLTQGRN